MEELMTTILSQISIWLPSLASICGIVGTIVISMAQLKSEIDKLKGDDYQSKLEKSNEQVKNELYSQTALTNAKLQDITELVKAISSENLELKRCNKLLIEELTHVKEHKDDEKI